MFQDKKVVEEVCGWFRIYDDDSIERILTSSSEFEFLVKPVSPHEEFIDGVATRDITIDQNLGLKARIYMPKVKFEDKSKLPIILHFHGGGFCISQADWYMYYHFYSQLVRSAQAICVSSEMRLAPEHRLPAACDDCYSALLWLQSVAQGETIDPWLEVHADFNRVFLMGDSAGGNLVHEVAVRAGANDLGSLRLVGGVPIHPGFVRAKRSKSELELESNSVFLTLEMVDKFLALALPLGSTKDHPITCPMGPAAPPLTGLKLPPLLVVVAQNDLMRDTQLEYYEAMKKAGQEVELLVSQGVSHCFYLNKVAINKDPHVAAQTDLLIAKITDFIKRH